MRRQMRRRPTVRPLAGAEVLVAERGPSPRRGVREKTWIEVALADLLAALSLRAAAIISYLVRVSKCFSLFSAMIFNVSFPRVFFFFLPSFCLSVCLSFVLCVFLPSFFARTRLKGTPWHSEKTKIAWSEERTTENGMYENISRKWIDGRFISSRNQTPKFPMLPKSERKKKKRNVRNIFRDESMANSYPLESYERCYRSVTITTVVH